MKRLLRSKLEIPSRRVSAVFLDRGKGIRRFHRKEQNKQQQQQQQQQHTTATAAVASCATKFGLNSAGLLQLGYRPYLGPIAVAASRGNGVHHKGTHGSNSTSFAFAAAAAAAVVAAVAAAAGGTSVSTEGRRFSDVYIDVENNTLGSGEFTVNNSAALLFALHFLGSLYCCYG